MKQYKLIFVYGFAIFAMFFGSGNLVFPLQIGKFSGTYWFFGFIGLFFTGILLPFMGLFVIKLYQGSYRSFFAEAGKFASVGLPLLTLSLLGSFGVVPRCITVAYGGMKYLIPNISLNIFSGVFCCLTYGMCLKDHRMVNVLGKWISPLLLISLGILIMTGWWCAPDIVHTGHLEESFFKGCLTGYQTMDLLAAFFFSALIFNHIQQGLPNTNDPKMIFKAALIPSILGAVMLGIIYYGFVFLGAHYGHLIDTLPPELMLPTIATYTLGSFSTWIISITIFLSCLTTAVALNNIYARYLNEFFGLKEDYFPWFLMGTTGVSFCISLLDFQGIAKFLSPILDVLYPGLIFLTLISIFIKGYQRIKAILFYMITFSMLIYYYLN